MNFPAPKRLSDVSAGVVRSASELAVAISEARHTRGTSEELARLERRLESLLGAAVVLGGQPHIAALSDLAQPAAAVASQTRKFALWAVAVMLAVAGALWVVHQQRPAPRVSPPAQPAQSRVVQSARESAPPAVVAPPALSPVVESPPSKRVAARARAGSGAKFEPAKIDAEGELVLLERSRAALAHDARLALELTEQHLRQYPRGVFSEEREILAIDALEKLRRRPEAFGRARAFITRYPHSTHARRVRGMLDTWVVSGGHGAAIP